MFETSKDAYPELIEKKEYPKSPSVEEQRFNETIDQGLEILKGFVSKLKENNKVLSMIVLNYMILIFPIDLTMEILAEEGLLRRRRLCERNGAQKKKSTSSKRR